MVPYSYNRLRLGAKWFWLSTSLQGGLKEVCAHRCQGQNNKVIKADTAVRSSYLVSSLNTILLHNLFALFSYSRSPFYQLVGFQKADGGVSNDTDQDWEWGIGFQGFLELRIRGFNFRSFGFTASSDRDLGSIHSVGGLVGFGRDQEWGRGFLRWGQVSIWSLGLELGFGNVAFRISVGINWTDLGSIMLDGMDVESRSGGWLGST